MPLSQPSPSTLPVRDDCWTEDDTLTLIEAWGERHLDLNRGNLRHKHWQEVAEAVNSRHGHDRKSLRTNIQCQNRIDTLKKKYKIEKARSLESGGSYVCAWPFFSCLDDLIGNSHKPSTPAAVSNWKTAPVTTPGFSLFSNVPVGLRSGTKKRRSTHVYRSFCDSYLRRDVNSKEDEGKYGTDSEDSRSLSSPRFNDREVGYRKLARAIGTIADIYERVEVAKQRHMVELEIQRMQFVKELEYQRMQLLMEMQLQIQKIKRARRDSGTEEKEEDSGRVHSQ
ncbi:trihelix transcription factor ASIL1 isoform X1 [Momordica charantia]|uniref:Trihelix transcription factor ASIL1 isoform X1 n=1 Tax=Momordica charantia TaxID=3673 RepID=A0A6J1D4A0_MOMCH|nr:trihelix transcription factor ASIL1 isoform X1 [Momordica charantia]